MTSVGRVGRAARAARNGLGVAALVAASVAVTTAPAGAVTPLDVAGLATIARSTPPSPYGACDWNVGYMLRTGQITIQQANAVGYTSCCLTGTCSASM